MATSGTEKSGLPMLTEPSRPRPSLLRNASTAAFVSQLLAARNNLPPQRVRRRNTTEVAIGAYSVGSKMAIKRMPLGFRTSIVA